MPTVTWEQALAWRMNRHLLEPVGNLGPEDVVRRLCGVQAQVSSSADFAIRARQANSEAGAVAEALADGRLVKTWAMRAALHLLTPEDAGDYMGLMAAGRPWQRPSWQRYFGLTPTEMDNLRDAVIEILGNRAMTREELTAEVTARPGFAHIGQGLKSGWGMLFKPIAWQGGLIHGPSQGTRITFIRPQVASRLWRPPPDPDEAGPRVLERYLAAYGPATLNNFAAWLSRGTIAPTRVKRWVLELGDRLTAVDVSGTATYLRSEDVDDLASTKSSNAVRLLGGFDTWVLGPGTDDTHVIPAARRNAVSKTAGWIAPIVVVGGVVRGTWEMGMGTVSVSWWKESGKPPSRAIEVEAARIGRIRGEKLQVAISTD
ncbi:MAG TPA: winged helix DNA-binding domain-containing protein [Candidatus Limnocylindrales bacterium]|nr:winged helix DNA-binding domain-containing protein [Candidatus Limnocylindrales bacterium]